MKSRWVTLILHTSSLIRKKKDELQVTHSWRSIGTVLTVIFLEFFLAIISLPLYLVEKTLTESSIAQVYRIRRTITLSLVGVLGVIWLIKIGLIVFTIVFSSRLPEFSVKNLPTTNPLVTSEEQIFETERATVNPNLSPPNITAAKRLTNGSVELVGTAPANTNVVIYLTRSDLLTPSKNMEQLTILTAYSDSQGKWSIRPKLSQLRFLAGNYLARAVTHDQKLQVKSATGNTVGFVLTRDEETAMTIVHDIDRLLNILVFVFIGVGLGLMLFVT